ncbi:AAA ATPase central domain protein [Methanocaldococcus vulcanius M7]|uniref:AAA ATPase central domain protein n=1 Tax=Methanocaldococcus vulcanius (strain ATCC 700851 / DSM 12094 / M7) TaxID=579137 RepID=C9RH07_METVM|nr:ATP-binding protein [Methanocaldococcus vulcanius]ACX72859.1 AAA ATPase central domain protein [Methanocaldococcus vulcanius M7]
MEIDLSGALMNQFKKAKLDYEKAKKNGNMSLAKKKALECSKLLKELAKYDTYNAKSYVEKAEKWQIVAENINEVFESKTKTTKSIKKSTFSQTNQSEEKEENEIDKFKNYVKNNLIQKSPVKWDDIGGLEDVKRLMMETIVISALQKPKSIQPWKGVLLFGPPGTGKTLLASACAGSLDATFFNVKASSVTSKYFGESSKIITALYEVARELSPSIVFIDEIDALTTKRGEGVSEASRRMLSTLLTELDGFQDKGKDLLVLTLSATNTPWDLDEAVLSRFPRRIYIPLPDKKATKEIIKINTKGIELNIDLDEIAEKCVERLYSGRDLKNLCQEAIWNMIRDVNKNLYELAKLPYNELRKRKLKTRALTNNDFEEAFKKIKSPLTKRDIEKYEKWAEEFGG